MGKWKSIENPKVASIFAAYPKEMRTKLMFLRRLIFDVASETGGVGELSETTRWGQPSYLTTQSGTGSLIRIDQIRSRPGKYAMYFHCQTTLIDTFKEMFRGDLEFEGNRGIVFDEIDQVPVKKLRQCILLALTYHLNKRPGSKRVTRRSVSCANAVRSPTRR